MLDVALKEWAVICDLLAEGSLTFLLRKGGIYEDQGPGRFRLEVDRFALFPAFEHQRPERIKPPFRPRVRRFGHEPTELTIRAIGQAAKIWQVPSRAAFDALEDLHPWTPPQIDMRFRYKPDRPLYLLAVRTYRLAAPRTLANRPAYAGCRSWVDLAADDAIDETGLEPALSDDAFAQVVARLEGAMMP